MTGNSLILLLVLAALTYLIYKVNRLEQLLGEGARSRRTPPRPAGDPKVIPILKPDIEPGPFRSGNQRRGQETPPESES